MREGKYGKEHELKNDRFNGDKMGARSDEIELYILGGGMTGLGAKKCRPSESLWKQFTKKFSQFHDLHLTFWAGNIGCKQELLFPDFQMATANQKSSILE